ncbi:hypothetical protein [Nitratireductor basaltis]|uniref:Uncharacterized protein n=1 Tax=Nitratireductor basaltis TaxID=472175 RepID=A0A084UAR7_9HYPH|nr:hypothetical protein [Nitratireductor basaltis]KFB10053.1 hypothetical protein EL18_01081 [Nitratireductor basaltis]
MGESSKRRANNPAQISGDIDAGRTGDKRPGFDPAAAPLSTDGEAGGVRMSEAQIREARISELSNQQHDKDVSYGDAMRPLNAKPAGGHYGFVALAAIVAAAAMIIAVVALLSM